MKAVPVEVSDITLSYGELPVLDRLSVRFEPGEFFTLLGPSGCGKSTLLRLIAGFNRASAGRVLIDGEDVTEMPPWDRNVGLVFQNYALWPHMTVFQNVAFGLEERRLPRAQVRRGVEQALDLVGLSALASRKPGQLSGGQQQRVALARTLAIEPRVLLLDEPLSNLDAKLRLHTRRELVALQRRLGITTIFVTHDQEEALTTADRVAVMDRGVIQQVGTPMELFDSPASRFVAEFIGTINLLPATILKGIGASVRVNTAAGDFDMPLIEDMPGHGEVTLAFRPHSAEIAPAARDSSRVWLPGRVEEREFLGEFVRYRVTAGGAALIIDSPHRAGDPGFVAGGLVALGLDPAQLRVLPS
jgi:iron(III) transport system ATP-binding protein